MSSEMMWKLVPVEPMPEMIDAAIFALNKFREKHGCNSVPPPLKHSIRYKAMLAAAPEPPAPAGEALTFSYRNWRGEVAVRRVQPLGIRFGSTEWHPEPQWLLQAVDLDKGEEREFAMRDIGAAPAGEVVACRHRYRYPDGRVSGWIHRRGLIQGHPASDRFAALEVEPLYTSPPTVSPDAVRRAALEEAAQEAYRAVRQWASEALARDTEAAIRFLVTEPAPDGRG